MEEVNKNKELDNTDKKLHISDVSVSLYTEDEAKELAYKILWKSTPYAYKIFADRDTFEYRWKELMSKKN